MSALGQMQTFAMQKTMSALPPKADICSALAYVRLGPIADLFGLHRPAHKGAALASTFDCPIIAVKVV